MAEKRNEVEVKAEELKNMGGVVEGLEKENKELKEVKKVETNTDDLIEDEKQETLKEARGYRKKLRRLFYGDRKDT